MTLKYCGIEVQHREVLLKDKPAAMLRASPKGTVPVLVHSDGSVLDESVDIMQWALAQRDPSGWLDYSEPAVTAMHALVLDTEQRFKPNLDRYKYNYYPKGDPRTQERYDCRSRCIEFLHNLNSRLLATSYLMGESLSFADVALFPFVRQFANVEPVWFSEQHMQSLQRWLSSLLDSELFLSVMQKHKVWLPETQTD